MDIGNLKMRDLAEVELLTGLNMDEWDTGSKVKLTMAIGLVMGRKTNPDLTWEQVEDMSIEEIQILTGVSELPKVTTS
jgi:hypothetical protein